VVEVVAQVVQVVAVGPEDLEKVKHRVLVVIQLVQLLHLMVYQFQHKPIQLQ
jgi:hypothetical protein